MLDTNLINSPKIKRDSDIFYTPPREDTKKYLKELSIMNILKNRSFEFLNIDRELINKNSNESSKKVLKLKKFESTSTVLSLNSKSKGNNTQDFIISPIYKENKRIRSISKGNETISFQNEEENQIKYINSPKSNKSLMKADFSSKNYLPRKRTCDIEIKTLNIENYFNNNYLPSNMNIEESEISQNYFSKMKRKSSITKNDNSECIGYNSCYSANILNPINNSVNLNTQNINFNNSAPNTILNYENFQQITVNSKTEFNGLNTTHNHISNLTDNINIQNGPVLNKGNSYFPIIKKEESISKFTNQYPHKKSLGREDSSREKKNNFVERQGDWICVKCKNLNFSFRIICNRCRLPKNELQNFYEEYVKNLSNIVQHNEMLQIQANQNCPNNHLYTLPNNYIQNSNVNNYLFNSNLFSINTINYNNKCKVTGAISKEFIHQK